MATSGTYTDLPTNLAVISAALRKINRLGDFETLTDTDVRYTAALAALKVIVKEYATWGMPLWAINEVAIPMSNFTTTSGVTIGLSKTIAQAAPLKIIQALRRDTLADIDVPMEVYTNDYYNSLSMKEATGAPVGYFYQPFGPGSTTDPAYGVLKIWPLPDSSYWQTNGQVYIRYQRPFQDVGSSTANLDFPQEWSRAIIYSLAYDLAPEYGIDMTQRQMLKADRDQLVAQALSFGTEQGSFNIQPRLRY